MAFEFNYICCQDIEENGCSSTTTKSSAYQSINYSTKLEKFNQEKSENK